MTDSSDISRLFKHIGVSDADYQEIHKQNGARESQSRWPLLNSLHAQANRAPQIDVRKRYDIGPELAEALAAGSAAKDALFTHVATDAVVQAHEQVISSLTQAADIDRHATDAAMAAVDAAAVDTAAVRTAAVSTAQPERHSPHKVAEFIAPRAAALGAHLRPSERRAPYISSVADESYNPAPVTSAPLAAPAFTQALVAKAPLTQAQAAATAAVAAPATAAVAAPATAAVAPSPSPLSTTGSTGGLFARLANPDAPLAATPVEPAASTAPVSLFDRLIRS